MPEYPEVYWDMESCGRKVLVTPVKSRFRVGGKMEPENHVGILESGRKEIPNGEIQEVNRGPVLGEKPPTTRQSLTKRKSRRKLWTDVQHRSKSGLPGRYEPFCWEGVALWPLPTRLNEY